MCGWHVHMQITCEQCPDATCRENHQYRLSHKSFIWSWNETTQHSCNKFYSITRSCQSRKIVHVHADHEECCRWCVDDMCVCRQCAGADDMCGWHADNVHVWMTCRRHVCADDMWTTYAADDVHLMLGVVLHEIRQLRQEERSHLEQLCIKPTGLLVGYDGNILWRNFFRLCAVWCFKTLNFVHWSQIYIQSKATTRNKNVTECFTFTLVREVMLIESWWFHALGSHFVWSKVTNTTATNIQLHLWHGLVITKLGTYKKRNHTWGKNPTP